MADSHERGFDNLDRLEGALTEEATPYIVVDGVPYVNAALLYVLEETGLMTYELLKATDRLDLATGAFHNFICVMHAMGHRALDTASLDEEIKQLPTT